MPERELLKTSFLNEQNFKNLERQKLKNDASFRSYERLITDRGSFILMDAPPTKEETLPFIRMSEFLRKNDLSAPEVLAQDTKNGFLLLEDFGNESFNNILNGKSVLSEELTEERVYEKAIDALIRLHKLPSIDIDLPRYNDAMLLKESNCFIDWYVSVLNGEASTKEMKEEFNLIVKHLMTISKRFGEVVVHRDYHADNLIWLEDRIAFRKVGMLDFQDAVIGSPIYDLVSLLEDARRDVSPSLADKMIKRYLKAFPTYSRKDFNVAYATLGVQRNLKIIGIFARQAAKYKNPSYLSMLPRIWRYIHHDLKNPQLLPLKQWLTKTVPSQMTIYKG
ncbi:MAG: phosphotransferase [Rickettsiales bacterium]|jgi:aminoglycoside/choline kinase family phosphotransferase|nr:phosphotransferase [Rickettsiales bacterium]